jgi:hypothetical protein
VVVDLNKAREAFAECVQLIEVRLPDLTSSRVVANLKHCLDMERRTRDFAPADKDKAMRWLGFVQGVMWAHGVADLETLKTMNRSGARAAEPKSSASNALWTSDEALVLVRSLSERLAPSYHVALAGSVLLRGSSQKDLDLIVYPTSTASACVDRVREALEAAGLILVHGVEVVHAKWRREGSLDEKHVEVWEYRGKRVDVFTWPMHATDNKE